MILTIEEVLVAEEDNQDETTKFLIKEIKNPCLKQGFFVILFCYDLQL